MTELCALLCGEPWFYKPWEVGRLSFYQIDNVLFHPRDKDGKIRTSGGGNYVDPAEFWVKARVREGMPKWMALQILKQKQEEAAAEREKVKRQVESLGI